MSTGETVHGFIMAAAGVVGVLNKQMSARSPSVHKTAMRGQGLPLLPAFDEQTPLISLRLSGCMSGTPLVGSSKQTLLPPAASCKLDMP